MTGRLAGAPPGFTTMDGMGRVAVWLLSMAVLCAAQGSPQEPRATVRVGGEGGIRSGARRHGFAERYRNDDG